MSYANGLNDSSSGNGYVDPYTELPNQQQTTSTNYTVLAFTILGIIGVVLCMIPFSIHMLKCLLRCIDILHDRASWCFKNSDTSISGDRSRSYRVSPINSVPHTPIVTPSQTPSVSRSNSVASLMHGVVAVEPIVQYNYNERNRYIIKSSVNTLDFVDEYKIEIPMPLN
jgi:hypothetical protein